MTPRVLEVCKVTTYLLNVFFDVTIACGEEDHLKELVPIIFQRMDQLFPLETFQKEVRKVMEVKLLAIFQRFPSFVVTLKVHHSF